MGNRPRLALILIAGVAGTTALAFVLGPALAAAGLVVIVMGGAAWDFYQKTATRPAAPPGNAPPPPRAETPQPARRASSFDSTLRQSGAEFPSSSSASKLDEALQEFSKTSRLDDALRDFEKSKPPQTPPPGAAAPPPPGPQRTADNPNQAKPTLPPSPRTPFDVFWQWVTGKAPRAQQGQASSSAPTAGAPPRPAYNPTLPDLSPHAHLTTALSYIGDVDKIAEKPVEWLQAVEFLGILYTAAQHVSRAREKDPTVVVTTRDKKGEETTYTPDIVALHILYREGRYAIVVAELSELPGSSRLEYLRQAQTAFESALRYKPSSSEYHYQLARIFKLLGDKERGLAAARKALECDPSNTDAIKYIDISGGTWQPIAADVPYKEPSKMPIKTTMVVAGFIIWVVAAQISSNVGGFLALIGVGLILAAGVMRWWEWRIDRDVKDSYREYEIKRSMAETSAMLRELHEQRYEREQQERRRNS